MTPDDAIFILENIKADGVAADAIKLGIQALKDIKQISNMETGNYVKPVRCKDCKCFSNFDGGYGKCSFFIGENQYVDMNGFCNLAERRTDESN